MLNISKCIRVYPVGYEKINVVGKVLLKPGRALIVWTENIKQKCFPVNGRAIDMKKCFACMDLVGVIVFGRKGKSLEPVLVGLIRTYVHTRVYIHTYIGKVHPRSGHECPEGEADV